MQWWTNIYITHITYARAKKNKTTTIATAALSLSLILIHANDQTNERRQFCLCIFHMGNGSVYVCVCMGKRYCWISHKSHKIITNHMKICDYFLWVVHRIPALICVRGEYVFCLFWLTKYTGICFWLLEKGEYVLINWWILNKKENFITQIKL